MNKVAIYVRVSTKEQAEHGYSIDEQLDRLRTFCKAKDYVIYKEYVDGGYSGASLDRPAMQELIVDAKERKFEAVVVYKLDRLSRSPKDTLYLIEDVLTPIGIGFISLSENFETHSPMGKATMGMASIFSQLERGLIQERMALGREAKIKQGKLVCGKPPIGYQVDADGKLYIDENDAEIVRLIYKMFLQGTSLNKICRFLKDNGYTPNYKQPITIKQMLSNKTYIGTIHMGDIEVENAHEPLIDRDTFDFVQLRLANLSKECSGGANFRATHLLSSKLYCKLCGDKCYAFSAKEKSGVRYHYYVCCGRKGNKLVAKDIHCKGKYVREEYFDKLITDKILSLAYEDIEIKTTKVDKIPKIKAEIKKLEAQKSRLIDLYALDSIDIDTLNQKISDIDNKIKSHHLTMQNDRESIVQNKVYKSTLENAKSILGQNGTLEQKRAVIDALIDRIEFSSKDDIDIYWNF